MWEDARAPEPPQQGVAEAGKAGTVGTRFLSHRTSPVKMFLQGPPSEPGNTSHWAQAKRIWKATAHCMKSSVEQLLRPKLSVKQE